VWWPQTDALWSVSGTRRRRLHILDVGPLRNGGMVRFRIRSGANRTYGFASSRSLRVRTFTLETPGGMRHLRVKDESPARCAGCSRKPSPARSGRSSILLAP
jgi:hypothetical protein